MKTVTETRGAMTLHDAVNLIGSDEVLRLCYDQKGLDYTNTATLRKASYLEKEFVRAVAQDWRRAEALNLIAAHGNEAIRLAERGL